MNQVSLTPEQVRQAAQSGVELLSNDDRVSLPPSMAKSGEFTVLIGVLSALASGQVVLGAPQQTQPPAPPAPPQPDDGEGDNGGEPPAEE